MSTAELQRYIDERTPEERAWMAQYLAWLNRPRNVRDATPEEIERLMPLVADIEAGRNCVSEEEFFKRLERLEVRERSHQ